MADALHQQALAVVDETPGFVHVVGIDDFVFGPVDDERTSPNPREIDQVRQFSEAQHVSAVLKKCAGAGIRQILELGNHLTLVGVADLRPDHGEKNV